MYKILHVVLIFIAIVFIVGIYFAPETYEFLNMPINKMTVKELAFILIIANIISR